MLRERLDEPAAPAAAIDESLVWDALYRSVRFPGVSHLSVFKSRLKKGEWESVLDVVGVLLHEGGCSALSRMHKRAVMMSMFECLYDALEERYGGEDQARYNFGGITLKKLVENIEHLPWAVDLNYPDYIKCGLLAQIAPVRRSVH